ncbi:MAG: hypothetical protein IPJ54_14055 [Saprospiraceae bacterium]|nr:hypothetical protein [Saprospiraceae bacterium]
MLATIVLSTVQAQSFDYNAAWKEVDTALASGLSQTALDKTKEIFDKAEKENNAPQYTRALVFMASLELVFGEDVALRVQEHFELALTKSTSPYKEIIHAYYAIFLNRYLQENRYEISARTASDDVRLKSISLNALSAMIDDHLNQSTSNLNLANYPISGFNVIVSGADQAESEYRLPTILHILYKLSIDIFGPRFLETADERSMSIIASSYREFAINNSTFSGHDNEHKLIDLFFQLQKINEEKAYTESAAYFDLERLKFARQLMITKEQKTGLENALTSGCTTFRKQPYVSMFYAELAAMSLETSDSNRFIKAKNYCNQGIALYPESIGGKICKNYLAEINQPSLSVMVESTAAEKQSIPYQITSRNLDKIYLKVISLPSYYKVNHEELEGAGWKDQLKNEKSIYSTKVSLTQNGEHLEIFSEGKLPSLKKGKYLLLASDSPEFNRAFTASVFQVTNLAYLHPNGNATDFILVVNRKTGKPEKGVKAEFYNLEYNYPNGNLRQPVGTGISDKEGKINKPAGIHNLGVVLKKSKDLFDADLTHYSYGQPNETPDYFRSEIYTDRPIYRPGQTLHFKVLHLSVTQNNVPSIVPDKELEIKLNDANGQLVRSVKLKTNEWGSASGSIEIPAGRLNGYYQLICGDYSKAVRVEEYKRPRFEVLLDSIQGQPALDQKIEIKGVSKFYSGLSLQNATVKYQIKRRELIPYCYRWFPQYFNTQETIITQGSTTTSTDGRFVFDFTAESSRGQNYHPIYQFQIIIDVLSPDGETQSLTQDLMLQIEPFIIQLEMDTKVDKSAKMYANVTVTNQAGLKLDQEVVVNAFSLKGPQHIENIPYWTNNLTFLPNPKQAPLPETFRNWTIDSKVATRAFSSLTQFDFSFLPAGVYLMEFEVKGNTPVKEVVVITDYKAKKWPLLKHVQHAVNQKSFEAGETLEVNLGAVEGDQMIFVTLLRGNKKIKQQWLTVKKLSTFTYKIINEDKGGLQLSYVYIKNNRFYTEEISIDVPWSEKELDVKWVSIRNKTEPGAKESIKLQISGSKAKEWAAEVMASLYDASLDALQKDNWQNQFFQNNYGYLFWDVPGFGLQYNHDINPEWNTLNLEEIPDGGQFPHLYEGYNNAFNVIFLRNYGQYAFSTAALADAAPAPDSREGGKMKSALEENATANGEESKQVKPTPRTNLNELVFFYPHLNTDEKGNLTFDFTMNEALTSWHLKIFAHTKALATAVSDQQLVTSKDWMILPNMPRLVRLGDKIVITATIANQSGTAGEATVNLELKDLLSGESCQNWVKQNLSPVYLENGGSATVSWPLDIPEAEASVLEYTISVISGKRGDAEKGILPLLSNEVVITESQPIIIRPGEKKKLDVPQLQTAFLKNTKPLQYGIEMTSHPAWFALQAMPFVVSNGYDNAIDNADKLYITALAIAIRNLYPQLDEVLDKWSAQTTEGSSALETNASWKNIQLEQSPWVGIANKEKEQTKQLLQILNPDLQNNELIKWKDKLMEQRMADGSFGWFKGGAFNHYTTCRVSISLGKANAFNVVPLMNEWMTPTISFLDNYLFNEYNRLLKETGNDASKLKNYIPSEDIICHLYARSFYKNLPMEATFKPVYQFYSDQALKASQQYSLMGQVMLASYDLRYKGQAWKNTAAALIEKAKTQTTTGMYWNAGTGLRWQEMPVESHAMIMDFLYESGADNGKLEEMKIWLLSHKKTHHWASTRATADAISALLLQKGPRQVNFTDADGVSVSAGGMRLPLSGKISAGSSYFMQEWSGKEIKPELGKLDLANNGSSVAFGAVYYQYLSPVKEVKQSQNSALTISKVLFREDRVGSTIKLTPLSADVILTPGDVLVSRLVVHSDRDLEFVHMSDLRGAGLEPFRALSSYNWKGSLGYYENVTDGATHYFVDRLPKGDHVFESRQRVVHRGAYSGALASIECLYAPEFRGNSEGSVIIVK